MAQPTATQSAPRSALAVPFKYLAVAICGAAVLSTELLHSLQGTADKAWFNGPIGEVLSLSSLQTLNPWSNPTLLHVI